MMNGTCGFAWLNNVQLLPLFVASYFDNNGCVLSYFEDCKYILLYKQHIDYSKIYPSFISIVLSLEKIY